MHFTVYDVFYSLRSHQHVSAATAAIFRLMLLLQEHKRTNVLPLLRKIKIILISFCLIN